MLAYKHRNGDMSIIAIVVLLLVIIGLVVWYALWGKPQPQESVTPSASSTVASTPDPYKGWKTYTTKYEKMSFKYPDNWTLVDESMTNENSDRLAITSPDGYLLRVWTNVWGIGGTCEDCKNFEMTETTVLDQTMGENIIGTSEGAQSIALNRMVYNGKVELTCKVFCTFESKIATPPGGDNRHGLTFVSGGYKAKNPDRGTYQAMDPATFKADANVKITRQFFKTLSY